METKNMTIQHFRKSIDQSPLRLVFFPIALVLTCFALSTPIALAVTPPPDGGYANLNTAEGDSALFSLTTGGDNTAVGFQALYSDTTGSLNTAVGRRALLTNNGDENVAVGAAALKLNTTGSVNTACGRSTLNSNTTGNFNTAIGLFALFSNTSGSDNVVVGAGMQVNDIGNDNLALGDTALPANTSGTRNIGVGAFAGGSTTGSDNVSLGFNAGIKVDTGSNNIDIGNQGIAGESNTIRIGTLVAANAVVPPDYPYSKTVAAHTATYIAGIYNTTIANGLVVKVNSKGHLGTEGSSERFKDGIKPMDKASEAILALKPVTFRYKHELDPKGIPQFGLVAEQVEKVDPDLVARDEKGQVYTVRYEAVNTMLLNEFLKEHSKVQTMEATTEQLKKQVEVLTAGLQKVSDQLELTKSTRRIVASNQ
jgi:endosialidase-like protein